MKILKAVWRTGALGILAIGLLGSSLLEGAKSAPKKWRPTIKMTKLPEFPQSLIDEGVTKGRVHVAIVVSEEGALLDWVVMEATYRELAGAVDSVIREWDFEGVRSLDEPRGEAFYLKIEFDASGPAIETSTPFDMSRHVFSRTGLPHLEGIRLAKPSELDALPQPIRAEHPSVSPDLLEGDRQVAVFEFFIDVDGSVHIPILASGESELDERILAASQNALWKWKFYPPTVKGRPVVVKVAQPLVFSRGEKSPAK